MFWCLDKFPLNLLSSIVNISLFQAVGTKICCLQNPGVQTSEEVHISHRGPQSKYLFVQIGTSAKLSHGTNQLLYFFHMELCQGMLFQPHMK